MRAQGADIQVPQQIPPDDNVLVEEHNLQSIVQQPATKLPMNPP